MIDFTNKIAVVTGGTRGIGKCIVEMLAEAGCTVVFTGTHSDGERCDRPNIRFEPLNMLDDTSMQGFCRRISAKYSCIDILINNAGINRIEPIDEIRQDNWDAILKVNLTGAMQVTRCVASIMKHAKAGGKIVNISSIFGIVSKEKRNSYSASKAGLIGLTRACALDLAPDNILVNALCPGFTKTELTASVLSEEQRVALAAEVPLQRFAEVEEIARVALFLASEFNTYITGQAITADGGFTIH
jgi:3-oxoacyl-[acyl-carrier protein] reductase